MKTIPSILLIFILISCQNNLKNHEKDITKTNLQIEDYGQHYQQHKDYKSLSKVVELMKLEVHKSYVKSILGEPIDMGFDYRYLVDSTGANNCVIGAVFHINENDKIDQKWIDEICE